MAMYPLEYYAAWEPASPAEPALTWTDNFIKDLLSDAEKYHDVLLDISTDVISDTMSKLAVSSEEFKAGADILGEQILGSLYKASDEVLHETYEELAPIFTQLAPPPKGTDDWMDEEAFNAKLAEMAARYNVDLDIDEKLDTFLGIQKEQWLSIGWDIDKMQQDIDLIQEGFPEFIAQKTADLAANSFSFLLDRLIDTFFEEV